MRKFIISGMLAAGIFQILSAQPRDTVSHPVITGDKFYQYFHMSTLTWTGPQCSEIGDTNPFTDYRLIVSFVQKESGGEIYRAPGYFAADGNAGQSGASSGNKWRVHYLNQWPGTFWVYISFRYGPNIAAKDWNDTSGSVAVTGITVTGDSTVLEDGDSLVLNFHLYNNDNLLSDAVFPDFRYYGKTGWSYQHTQHQLLHTFLAKSPLLLLGTASPSNFLAYADFDNTPNNLDGLLKTWSLYDSYWNAGDSTDVNSIWNSGLKGKGIIGAINYLSSKGVNALSFTTMDINGTDHSIYPFIAADSLTRFDCSKLDQWQLVLNHAQERGLFLTVKTQIPENLTLLDSTKRKIYYRELIARFGHFPGIAWHLGDRTTQTSAELLSQLQYLRVHDGFAFGAAGERCALISAPAGSDSAIYTPLLGDTLVKMIALETGINDAHSKTLEWVQKSKTAYNAWIVSCGLQIPGVPTNTSQSTIDSVRKYVLWGNLMAGGGGVTYYFGSSGTDADLTCQNFQSRDSLWEFDSHALEFFGNYLFGGLSGTFYYMSNFDSLVSNPEAYCLGYNWEDFSTWPSVWKVSEPFAVYLPNGGTTDIDLSGVDTSSMFKPWYATNPYLRVWWFNPRSGGNLIKGDSLLGGPGTPLRSIGTSPTTGEDWAALILPDTGNPGAGIKVKQPVSINPTSFKTLMYKTRDGWIRFNHPKIDAHAVIEIVRFDGRLFASIKPKSTNRFEYRCTSRGFYLICSRIHGKRTVLARVLFM